MSAKDVAVVALFAALTCALGLAPIIPLPIVGITFSLQTLGVLLAGGIIGAKRGAMSQGLVILLVAIGLPVLTGGQGGLGKLIGVTGGFVWSWPIGAFVAGLIIERWWTKLGTIRAIAASVIGSICLYPLGQTWLAVTTSMPLRTAAWSWVAYLPGDVIKSAFAGIAIVTVKKAYPLISPRKTPA